MRRIAVINQKGGVGKTTTSVNLGAALARAGRRVVLVDLDPQANLSMHLDVQLRSEEPSIYAVLLGDQGLAQVVRATSTPGMGLVASSLDLSGAELELANAFGREMLLREALDLWEREHRAAHGTAPADYVLLDCPPSLGLLSVNGLVAASEAVIALQTEFFALQGMSRLVDVVQLLRRRLNPRLEITGILPCLYDSRLKLAREVLAEIRAYFPGQVFRRPIAKNVKLAEAPSYGKTIFEYAPDSPGAQDYTLVAAEVMAQEARDRDLAPLARPPVPCAELEEQATAAAKAPEVSKDAPTPPATAAAPRTPAALPDKSAPPSAASAALPPREPPTAPPAALAEPERKVVLVPQPPARVPAPPRPQAQHSTPDDLILGAAPELEELPPLPDDALEIGS